MYDPVSDTHQTIHVHPNAHELAERFGYQIDEKQSILNLRGTKDIAVMLSIPREDYLYSPPATVPYVWSRFPADTIVLFCEEGHPFVRGRPNVRRYIDLDEWDWKSAHFPDSRSTSTNPPPTGYTDRQHGINSYLLGLITRRDERQKHAKLQVRHTAEVLRLRQEKAASEREARLAAMPEDLRAFIDAGAQHGLAYDSSDRIGGAIRFVRFECLTPSTLRDWEPVPDGLPWIESDSDLLVAMPRDQVPDDQPVREVTASSVRHCRRAVWPTTLADYPTGAFHRFLDTRREHELRRPDFFAADLYDADRDEPTLVAGLLPEAGISIVAGAYDSGKTILLVDLVAHIAYGLPWLGREVAVRPVIYYALEAGDDVIKRLQATGEKLEQGRGSPLGSGSPPVIVRGEIPATFEDWCDEVNQLSAEICERLALRCADQEIQFPDDYPYEGSAVVVIDTLRQACDHRSQGPVVEAFFSKVSQLVMSGVASHVIIAHHTTKSGDVYAGDDFLASDSTSLYYVRRPRRDAATFRLVCDRVKGMAKPLAITLGFRVVDIGEQQTVVLGEDRGVNPKLRAIAESLPERMSTKDLRKALEPYLTGKTDAARTKSFGRVRAKLVEAGLIVREGQEYLRCL